MTIVNRYCIECHNEQLANRGLTTELSSTGLSAAASMSAGSTGVEPAETAGATDGEGSNVVEFHARESRTGTRSHWLLGSEAGMATAEYTAVVSS